MSQPYYEQRLAVALRCRIIRDSVFYCNELQHLDTDTLRIGYNNISNKIQNLFYDSVADFNDDLKQFTEKLRMNNTIQDTTLKNLENKIAEVHNTTNTSSNCTIKEIDNRKTNQTRYNSGEMTLSTLFNNTLHMISSKEIAKNTFQILKSLYDHGVEHGNLLNQCHLEVVTSPTKMIKSSPITTSTVPKTKPLSAMALQIKNFRSSLKITSDVCDNVLKSEISNYSSDNDSKRKQSLDDSFVDTKKFKVEENVPVNSFALNTDIMKGIDIVYVSNVPNYLASVVVCDKIVQIGVFTSIHEAARAHDLALLRAIGPNNCSDSELNFSLLSYSSTPLIQFTMHDDTLRKQLFGSSWIGVQDCDFSPVLIQNK